VDCVALVNTINNIINTINCVCLLGALCKNRHVRRVMCVNYLCGFCLEGPNCKFVQSVLFTFFVTFSLSINALQCFTNYHSVSF